MAIVSNTLVTGVGASSAPFFGIYDYNDTATTTTPIAYTGTEVKFTNNGLGVNTKLNFPADGVVNTWNTGTNFFTFTGMPLGSTMNIRLDYTVTTTTVNQPINVVLRLGIGGSPYNLTLPTVLNKSAGTYNIVTNISMYIGDTNTKNNAGAFYLTSDANCSVVVNGWATEVLLRI